MLLTESVAPPATTTELETELETENKSCFNWIIRNNYPEADFWLINKGSQQKLGHPLKEFEPFLTGIKCPTLILPDYGYYLCLHLHQQGLWKKYSIGSISWKNLRLKDIKAAFKEIGRHHKQQHQARYKNFVPVPVADFEIKCA